MDAGTVEQLYLRFGPMVLARARVLLRDELAAQDALQEVFVRALRAGHRFRAEASPATWLYRITTNYCLNCLRDEVRRSELWSLHGAEREPAGEPSAAARIQIAQILGRVRPELQEIALYSIVDELSHEEIAELLGVSRRTIGNRLEEFRAEVALILEPTPEVT
jgi:RNA polymerase sigma-70 factor (ECF subfamily)